MTRPMTEAHKIPRISFSMSYGAYLACLMALMTDKMLQNCRKRDVLATLAAGRTPDAINQFRSGPLC